MLTHFAPYDFFYLLICFNFPLVLPVLTSLPRVVPESITATSVMLEWDAWNQDAGDSGDGPIVAYNVYDRISMMQFQTEVVTQDVISPIQILIQNLSPVAVYNFEVRPVREGLGGEGTATQNVQVFTAPSPTNPSPPHSQVTTEISTSRTVTKAFMPTNTVETPKGRATAKTKGIHFYSMVSQDVQCSNRSKQLVSFNRLWNV